MELTEINHIQYVMPMILLFMASFVGSLQKLINMWQLFKEDYDIVFYVAKTKCIVCRSKSYIAIGPIITLYNNKEVEFVEQFKYH